MKKDIFVLLLFLILSSCQFFEYHPYDGELSVPIKKGYNSYYRMLIDDVCGRKDTIRFVWFGDSGRSLNDLKACVRHMNENKLIDFAIHAGDLTEFGLRKEYEWAEAILSKLNCPYMALIGNHDIIGNGDVLFDYIYGEEDFCFRVNDVLFVCLNTNALEYNYTKAIPNFDFLEASLKEHAYPENDGAWKCERTIVAMHAPPGNEQFNNNVKDIFHAKLKEFPSLLFCLYGHTHNFAVNDLFNDGIPYIACDNVAKRSYILFTITPDNYDYELVRF